MSQLADVLGGSVSYAHLDISFDAARGILFQRMRPRPRPCYTLELLQEMRAHDESIEASKGQIIAQGQAIPVDYVVYGSSVQGAFNLGGDLSKFLELYARGDRATLSAYAQACINIQWPRLNNFNLPLTTISLVQGRAFGGGFENALASNVIIAEAASQFAFPEVTFNLFPGMGGYSILARRIGRKHATEMILSGDTYSATELAKLGVVDMVVPDGEGLDGVYEYVRQQSKKRNTVLSMQRVRERADPITRAEMSDIVSVWVDSVFKITRRDVRIIERYIALQNKMWAGLPIAPLLQMPASAGEREALTVIRAGNQVSTLALR